MERGGLREVSTGQGGVVAELDLGDPGSNAHPALKCTGCLWASLSIPAKLTSQGYREDTMGEGRTTYATLRRRVELKNNALSR